MGELILVLGGARSGKTTYAQRLGQQMAGERVLFVATAESGDDEMQARIAAHRAARPAAWRTLEAPRRAGEAIAAGAGDAQVVLVDCLTFLVANAVMAFGDEPDPVAAQAAVVAEVSALLETQSRERAIFIVVSNEVGQGLVPPYPLGRVYRDLLGLANQTVAAQAQRVYWMVAGIPVDVKALAQAQLVSQMGHRPGGSTT